MGFERRNTPRSYEWLAKIGFIISMWFVFGTYRRFRATPKSLKHLWTVGFWDLPASSHPLRRFARIEVKYHRSTSYSELMSSFSDFASSQRYLRETFRVLSKAYIRYVSPSCQTM